MFLFRRSLGVRTLQLHQNKWGNIYKHGDVKVCKVGDYTKEEEPLFKLLTNSDSQDTGLIRNYIFLGI